MRAGREGQTTERVVRQVELMPEARPPRKAAG